MNNICSNYMNSLLENDYNDKNYQKELNTDLTFFSIYIPDGRLGMELSISDNNYYVSNIEDTSPIKNILHVGDIIISLNEILLHNYTFDELYDLFKNISNRKLSVKRH